MNPNKALWEKGDFTAIAGFMRESGEVVVRSLGIRPPLMALDLGCGDGTTAVPLAQMGADVTGIDVARNLVEAGNRRAKQAGLPRLKFQEGDACNLQGVDDHSFDLTLSVFGPCLRPSLTMWLKRWFALPNQAAASSWAIGFQMIQHSFRRCLRSALPLRPHLQKASSVR